MHMDGFSPSVSSQCSRTLRGAGYRIHRNRFVISDSSLLSVPQMAMAPGAINYWNVVQAS